MRRIIDAPDKEWLSKMEAARWLGLHHKLFQHMVDRGELPAGVKMGHKTIKWHWRDVLAMSIVLSWKRPGPPAG